MRNLTDDKKKKKKLMSDIIKSLDDDLIDALKNGNWRSYSIPPFPSFLPGMSPTDIDAKGMYDYQVPEMDEQGTYYGYKILYRKSVFVQSIGTLCDCDECQTLISPRYESRWTNGELQADKVPAESTMFGIHFTKRPDHPELKSYIRDSYGYDSSYSYYEYKGNKSVLVKCALSGTIVETEQGFRAEHAQIVGVYINGNWQGYQDYQERSRTYSRTITRKEWEEEEGWKYNKPRYWDTSSDAQP